LHYMPSVSNSNPPQVIDVLVPEINCYIDVARALYTRAMLKFHKGDVDGAWQDILTTHRLARLVQHGPTIIRQLVALAIENLAAEGGITLATSGQLTPQKARLMLQNVATLQPVGDVVNSIDNSERFMMLDIIMMLSRGQSGPVGVNKPTDLDLDWNKMLREANGWYDRIVEPLRLPRFQGRKEALEACFQESEPMVSKNSLAKKRFLVMLGGRLSRKIYTQMFTELLLYLVPSVSRSVDVQDAARMNFEIEKLAIALAWFHGDKGHWPDGLGELVPKYLPAVPADCFSQNPLIYQPTKQGYLLYSVGKNQRDDGGIDNPAEDKDDIVAEVK
ncbi:MAG: hypothetical protein K8S55_04495, partial [Phycisphaerae bacterium]|nr:hypothetical protein [Phycisphaerae bacterium]